MASPSRLGPVLRSEKETFDFSFSNPSLEASGRGQPFFREKFPQSRLRPVHRAPHPTGGGALGGSWTLPRFRCPRREITASVATKIPTPARTATNKTASCRSRGGTGGGGGSVRETRKASMPPAFVAPGNEPPVSPATYTPDPPTATPLALSNRDVPNWRTPRSVPLTSYRNRNASELPALV